MINVPARPMAPATNLYVETCECTHSGEAPLFILPGGPGANRTHFSSYRCLQDEIELVFHDPRGCGGSEKSHSMHYTLNNYIDDIEAIRKALNLDKISLLGKSYGGMPALGYAIRFPECVDKLILVSTGPSYHFTISAREKLLQIGTPEQIKVSQKLWNGRFKSPEEVDDYFRLMMPLYSTKPPIEQAEQEEIIPFAHEPLNRGFLADLKKVDFREQLKDISAQTLIIAGDHDWIFDQKYSELMYKLIPNSKLVVMKDVGHFIETDAGDKFFNCIRTFYKK